MDNKRGRGNNSATSNNRARRGRGRGGVSGNTRGGPPRKSEAELRDNARAERDTKIPSADRKAKLDSLWRYLKIASPEDAQKIIDTLDEDTIVALRTMKNPYSLPVHLKEEGCIAMSFTNLKEMHERRRTMTSLIGFEYRMLDEHDEIEDDEGEVITQFSKLESAVSAMAKSTMLTPSTVGHDGIGLVAEPALSTAVVSDAVVEPVAVGVGKDNSAKQVAVGKANAVKKYIDENCYDFQEAFRSESERIQREMIARLYPGTDAPDVLRRAKCHLYFAKKDAEIADKTFISAQKKKADLEDTRALVIQLCKSLGKRIEMRDKYAAVDADTSLSPEARAVALRELLNDMGDSDHLVDVAHMKRQFALRIKELDVAEKKVDEYLQPYAQCEKAKIVATQAVDDINVTIVSVRAACGGDIHVDIPKVGEDEEAEAREAVKRKFGIKKTLQDKVVKRNNHIKRFLDKYLKFNPEHHIRTAYKPNPDDKSRTPLSETAAKDLAEGNYERTIIPPADTFHRWANYIDSNYDALKRATNDIYVEKSDYEVCVAPLKVFLGADSDAKFNEFKKKYADELDAEVFQIKIGSWTFLDAFEKNRANVDFFTKDTVIVEKMLEQIKDDQRIGSNMVKKRADDKVKQNKKKVGPSDAKGLREYRAGNPTAAAIENVYGVKKASEIPQDAEEADKDHIEVPVHEFKVQRANGRVKVVPTSTHFNIPTDKEEAEMHRMGGMSGADYVKNTTTPE